MGKYNSHTCPLKITKEEFDISFIITTSLNHYKNDYDRSVYKIGEQYLFEYHFDTIKNIFPKSEIIYVAGKNYQKIARYKPKEMKLIENSQYENCTELRDVRLALNMIGNKRVCIIPSNCLFISDAISNIFRAPSFTYLTKEELKTKQRTMGCIGQSKLESLNFGAGKKWTGVIYYTGRELEKLQSFLNTQTDNILHFEIINKIINRGGIFACLENEMIGFYEDSLPKKQKQNERQYSA